MAQPMTVQLNKGDSPNLGFRLQGGVDFAAPLVIQKVNGGSPAERAGLLAGDAVIKINSTDVYNLRHKDAQDVIIKAGPSFAITVQRGGSTWKPSVTPTGSLAQGTPGLVTKTSLAAKPQPSIGAIGTGHNLAAKPFANGTSNGGPKLVNKQYNSPIGLYSEQSIAETLSAQSEVLSTGVLGVNFKKNEKNYDATKSAVYHMLQEAENEPRSESETLPNHPIIRLMYSCNIKSNPRLHSEIHARLRYFNGPEKNAQKEHVDTGLSPAVSNFGLRHVQAPETKQAAPAAPQLPPGQNVCADCERLIVGVFVRIKDKNLHVECFKCSTCGCSLKNVGYYNINQKLYCDVHAKLAAKSNAPGPNLVPVTLPPGSRAPAGTISAALTSHPLPSPAPLSPKIGPASPSSNITAAPFLLDKSLPRKAPPDDAGLLDFNSNYQSHDDIDGKLLKSLTIAAARKTKAGGGLPVDDYIYEANATKRYDDLAYQIAAASKRSNASLNETNVNSKTDAFVEHDANQTKTTPYRPTPIPYSQFSTKVNKAGYTNAPRPFSSVAAPLSPNSYSKPLPRTPTAAPPPPSQFSAPAPVSAPGSFTAKPAGGMPKDQVQVVYNIVWPPISDGQELPTACPVYYPPPSQVKFPQQREQINYQEEEIVNGREFNQSTVESHNYRQEQVERNRVESCSSRSETYSNKGEYCSKRAESSEACANRGISCWSTEESASGLKAKESCNSRSGSCLDAKETGSWLNSYPPCNNRAASQSGSLCGDQAERDYTDLEDYTNTLKAMEHQKMSICSTEVSHLTGRKSMVQCAETLSDALQTQMLVDSIVVKKRPKSPPPLDADPMKQVEERMRNIQQQQQEVKSVCANPCDKSCCNQGCETCAFKEPADLKYLHDYQKAEELKKKVQNAVPHRYETPMVAALKTTPANPVCISPDIFSYIPAKHSTSALASALSIAPSEPFNPVAPRSLVPVPLPEETVPYFPPEHPKPPVETKPVKKEFEQPVSPFVDALKIAPERPFTPIGKGPTPIRQKPPPDPLLKDLPKPQQRMSMLEALTTTPDRNYSPLIPDIVVPVKQEEEIKAKAVPKKVIKLPQPQPFISTMVNTFEGTRGEAEHELMMHEQGLTHGGKEELYQQQETQQIRQEERHHKSEKHVTIAEDVVARQSEQVIMKKPMQLASGLHKSEFLPSYQTSLQYEEEIQLPHHKNINKLLNPKKSRIVPEAGPLLRPQPHHDTQTPPPQNIRPVKIVQSDQVLNAASFQVITDDFHAPSSSTPQRLGTPSASLINKAPSAIPYYQQNLVATEFLAPEINVFDPKSPATSRSPSPCPGGGGGGARSPSPFRPPPRSKSPAQGPPPNPLKKEDVKQAPQFQHDFQREKAKDSISGYIPHHKERYEGIMKREGEVYDEQSGSQQQVQYGLSAQQQQIQYNQQQQAQYGQRQQQHAQVSQRQEFSTQQQAQYSQQQSVQQQQYGLQQQQQQNAQKLYEQQQQNAQQRVQQQHQQQVCSQQQYNQQQAQQQYNQQQVQAHAQAQQQYNQQQAQAQAQAQQQYNQQAQAHAQAQAQQQYNQQQAQAQAQAQQQYNQQAQAHAQVQAQAHAQVQQQYNQQQLVCTEKDHRGNNVVAIQSRSVVEQRQPSFQTRTEQMESRSQTTGQNYQQQTQQVAKKQEAQRSGQFGNVSVQERAKHEQLGSKMQMESVESGQNVQIQRKKTVSEEYEHSRKEATLEIVKQHPFRNVNAPVIEEPGLIGLHVTNPHPLNSPFLRAQPQNPPPPPVPTPLIQKRTVAPCRQPENVPPPPHPPSKFSVPVPPIVAPKRGAVDVKPDVPASSVGGAGSGRQASSVFAPKRGRGVLNVGGMVGNRIPLCGSCHQQIRGPFITALGKIWCPDHFVCNTPSCKRPLQDIGFVEEQGNLHCEYCFERYLAPDCCKCSSKIKGDCLKAIGKNFHPECFNCAYCGKLFGNSPFFLEDGLPYCETDWNEMFTTKCFACGFPVEAGDRWVEALSNNYHSQCFNCTMCKKNLEGQSFFAKGGRPFCKNHAR